MTKTVTPNEKINAAFIGCGGMGVANLKAFQRTERVNIVAVCDIDQSHLDKAVALYPGAQPVADWRRILDLPNVDVVVNSAPDHWHALPTIYACQAGKDVYVEKPLSHNIVEGRTMVEAARCYKRVVQGGTQQRTDPHFSDAVRYVQSGMLGNILLVRTWNASNEGKGIGFAQDESEPPAGIDYDMWLGPVPLLPFNKLRFHYTFRWFFDYAGGMLADWGVHLNDVVLWAMEVDAPSRISAAGGHWALRDGRETPDVLEVTYEFDSGGGVNNRPFLLVYSMQKGNARGREQKGYGIEFFGTNATLFVDRDGWEVIPEGESVPAEKHPGADAKVPHIHDFLDCVMGAKGGDGQRPRPASDVEIAHRATSICCLGNIAYRTGEKLTWNREKELCFDPYGNPIAEANALLTREARTPWTLPKIPNAS